MAVARVFFTDGRLVRISLSIIIAIAISIIITLAKEDSRESLITRGDFPGLLVQGVILSRGEPERLYDFEYQRQIENQIWPSFNGGLYVSVYPPYHAFLMRPFAGLPALYSQAIFIGLMLLALLLTLRIICKLNSTAPKNILILIAISLAFPPLFFGILGAQNTAISMLLVAIVLYQIKKATPLSDFLAGLALGAWLFKPQFALFGIATAFLMWRFWILFGAAIIASIYYYMASTLMGPLWIIKWIKATSIFSIQNYLVNGSQMSSLIATAKMILISLGIQPDSDTFSNISLIAHSFILLLLAYLMTRVVTLRIQKHITAYQAFLFVGPAITLFSPNTLFYDLGIALVPLLIMANFKGDITYWRGLLLWSSLGILIALRGVLPIPLFFLFPLYVGWSLQRSLKYETNPLKPS